MVKPSNIGLCSSQKHLWSSIVIASRINGLSLLENGKVIALLARREQSFIRGNGNLFVGLSA